MLVSVIEIWTWIYEYGAHLWHLIQQSVIMITVSHSSIRKLL